MEESLKEVVSCMLDFLHNGIKNLQEEVDYKTELKELKGKYSRTTYKDDEELIVLNERLNVFKDIQGKFKTELKDNDIDEHYDLDV